MGESNIGISFSASIHEIEWERVKLKISGLIEGSVKNEKYTFSLKNEKTNTIIPIKQIGIKGHAFELIVNVTTIYENDRIPDGKWNVIISDSNNNERKVKLASNLKYNGKNAFDQQFSKDFKSGPKKFYKFHIEMNKKDSSIYFDVFFEHPKPKKAKKLTLKKRLANVREDMFDWIFNISKKLVKKNGKRVLFTSASRSEMGGNLGAVHDRLVERGLDKEYKLYQVFKSNIHSRSSWLDKFKLPFYLGIADYIFIEDFQPMVNKLEYDNKTEIIQLWHANGAFKTFGYSRLGKPASPVIDGFNHRIYTKAITSSKHVIPYYAEAFAMDEKNVIATGIPKTDIFFDEEYRRTTTEKIHNIYPQIKNADKVILFGPTFRGGGPKTAYYPMNKLDFESLAEYCRKHNAIAIFKMHFLVKNKLEIPEQYADIFIDATDYREINDILFVADVLITDYSSTVYEYSLLNKPMLFYAFDLEEYISARDFYDKFEDFVPGKIVRTFDDLIHSLEKEEYEFEKVELFRQKNFEFLNGGASDRVIDWIILNKQQSEI
ncbi:CDP-glycerol glycerophosphotransferase family protein [Neobacillus jeddahensis]|uniref:CDP-glycerol glycerophosphotransferase family protein n=1 Tax=Neobacillus jeddahensis TaxID=1461580 RepID=UPI0005A60816|nr:CDP-glycerol glycerophosphotransferase family protein [Neobacillus jeddahensis]